MSHEVRDPRSTPGVLPNDAAEFVMAQHLRSCWAPRRLAMCFFGSRFQMFTTIKNIYIASSLRDLLHDVIQMLTHA